jgi:hypothetical protein
MSIWVILVAFDYANEPGSLVLHCGLITELLLEIRCMKRGAPLDTNLLMEQLIANNMLFTLETLSFLMCHCSKSC